MSILIPPGDAVTVTSAVEGRAEEEVAARVPRCGGGEGSISLWRRVETLHLVPTTVTILFSLIDRYDAATSGLRYPPKGAV